MASISKYYDADKAKNANVGRLLDWVDEHSSNMLDDPQNGLEAIGIGKKNSIDLSTEEEQWCITGFVKEKLTKKTLKEQNYNVFADVATTLGGAREFNEPEMDVVEIGGAFSPQSASKWHAIQRGQLGGPPPSVDLQKKFDTLRAGVGITNPERAYPNSASVGTFGFAVRDSNNVAYLISNNHVIAQNNTAKVGDDIVQPGTLDLTQTEFQVMNTIAKLRSRLRIAELSAWVDIDFSGLLNEVDVAIAELTDDRDLSELGRIGFGAAARGIASKFSFQANGTLAGDTRVYKAGRTTGWTEGTVAAIGVSTSIGYPAGTARFRNQIAVVPTPDNPGVFSDRGDSGSGVWNSSNELVGLLFAGSPQRTLINPIDRVMSEIESELNQGQLSLIT